MLEVKLREVIKRNFSAADLEKDLKDILHKIKGEN